jgi:hypothetical protein
MFATHLRLTLSESSGQRPVPKAWLDHYFMRNFLGPRAFDETLSADDGLLEASFSVKANEVRDEFEEWLRGRKMISPDTSLLVEIVE